MRSLGANEFGFAGAHRLTNGQMRLTATNGTDVVEIYSYTVWHTSTVVVTVWTNEYDEVITSTNFVWDPVSPPYAGIESEWACQTTNLVLAGGVGTWDDADVSTNARVRFYAAAKRMDSDGDGLSDGMEIFLYRTDPGLPDSDGDGWSDAEELAEETDPLDRFNAPRLARGVVINEVLYDDGTAEQRGEWIELYSAGRYPVNLDGFQIEVGNGDFDPVYALPNVWLHAGQALLLGGSEVAGRDQGPDAGFGMPNRGYSGPTAAVRLVATNEGLRVVDCLMYGGNVYNFNSDGLDSTGWISETAYYAGAGSSLYRRYPGHDTDQAGDWRWTNGPTPQNTNFVFDTDGDELTDEQEWTGSLNNGVPTNPYDPDSDGDGLDDHAECVEHYTNPNAWATDGDLFPWPPASGGVTNWPGSDSYEIAHGWNPLVADQNSNGIPDSWEMAFPGTNLYGHADSDGVTNLTELLQNSNPFDAASSNAQPYVLRFESSIGEWTNGLWQDVGLNGWVRVWFGQIATNVDICLWIVEGSNTEPFTVTWSGVADGTVTMVDDQHALASATLLTGSRPSLLVKDNGAHPNYTNTLGGEYKIDVIKVELKSIEFTSDHNSLKKDPASGSVWDDSSTDYETPEWVAGTRNNPISHTKNTKISATVTVKVEPVDINFDLIGNGPDDYVDFEKNGQISTGSDQPITVTADANLPDEIGILNKSINWKIKVGSLECSASSSGSHKIYVTYGTPTGSDPTDQRISWSCERCVGNTALDDIVLAAHAYINTNDPPHFYVATGAWPSNTPPIWMLLDPSHPGGSCIAHANLLKHISNILGIPGGSLTYIYSSSDSNFDSDETHSISGRTCTVVVVTPTPEANFFEGCLEMNSRYYPGAFDTSSFSSKQAVHAVYAAWPNRLIFMTKDGGPLRFFDKNHVEYTDPLSISQSACIPIP